MKIGIIGAGDVGSTLTRLLTRLGHQVAVANSRGPETLAGLAAETGAAAVSGAEAAAFGEIVILANPQKAIASLPHELFANTGRNAIAVDAGNYYPFRDGPLPEYDSSRTDSEWVEQQIGRPVIKAFNNILDESLLEMGKPVGTPGRVALSVAGASAADKEKVIQIIDELGFDGIDAGGLEESWRQQPGSPAYCKDIDADALRRALASGGRSTVAAEFAAVDAEWARKTAEAAAGR